jgi:hypothetical protein
MVVGELVVRGAAHVTAGILLVDQFDGHEQRRERSRSTSLIRVRRRVMFRSGNTPCGALEEYFFLC